MPVLEEGRRLAGRYTLLRPLGRGSRGEVWLATAEPDGAPVALKFVAGAAAARAEAGVAAPVVHPHVVRTLGWHEDAGHAFIVQELVADARPAGVLRAGGFRVILPALAGVADALGHLHRRGVVHGDLKPSNVLCDASGHCRLADFGAAVAGEGNLPALSPQRLAGAAPTPGDDVYGFGALLVDLLAGQPPFHPGVTAARVRDEIPVLPAADLAGNVLPAALLQLLRALLHKEPAGRPPGMAAVCGAMEEVLADAAAPADPMRPVPPAVAPPAAVVAGCGEEI
jgi:serine/threonine protein kinase